MWRRLRWFKPWPVATITGKHNRRPSCNSTNILLDDNTMRRCALRQGHLGSCIFERRSADVGE